MNGIVRIALDRPYTFVVLALLILIVGPLAALRTPTDIFPDIRIPVIAQGSGADSASVIFDALQTARSRGTDVLIADTAGRLHTQSGLMDELSKIRRVLAKLDTEAPHEVLLVIDGTTGQNAISQTRQFRDAIGVTGLVVTKLDGTAKGGIVFALAREFGLPIRYVGLGESAEDLRVFDATAFVDGLLPAKLGDA
jgi:fused signal recognition particle receptor